MGNISKNGHLDLLMNVLDAFLGDRHIKLYLADDGVKFHCL